MGSLAFPISDGRQNVISSGAFKTSLGGGPSIQQPYLTAPILPPDEHFAGELFGGMNPKQAITLFCSGFALGFSGGWIFKSLRGPGASGSLKADAMSVGKPPLSSLGDSAPLSTTGLSAASQGLSEDLKKDEVNIWLLFQDQMTSLYRLALHKPEQRQTLMAYGASGLISYLGASLLQGTQETWVRRKETQIRTRLLGKMGSTVQESIRMKHLMDNQMRDEAKQRVLQLMVKNNLPASFYPASLNPVEESLKDLQHYFVEPTHRRLKFGQATFQNEFPPGENQFPSGDHQKAVGLSSPISLGVLAVGGVMGYAAHWVLKAMNRSLKSLSSEMQATSVERKIVETINVPNQEALFVLGWNRNKSIILGIMALTGLAKVGKLWIDGLREIEVTRRNATTEFQYQKNNWLQLDPYFHQIAEREALENDLKQLEEDLPRLRKDPTGFANRVQTILNNVGRNSAPKYYPMIPMVGLREARS
jgi:hypothetical protein